MLPNDHLNDELIQKRQRVEEYARVVSHEFPGCEVILFGSYVNGYLYEYSDIVVHVIFPEIMGDFLTLAERLHHL